MFSYSVFQVINRAHTPFYTCLCCANAGLPRDFYLFHQNVGLQMWLICSLCDYNTHTDTHTGGTHPGLKQSSSRIALILGGIKPASGEESSSEFTAWCLERCVCCFWLFARWGLSRTCWLESRWRATPANQTYNIEVCWATYCLQQETLRLWLVTWVQLFKVTWSGKQ